MSYIAGVAVKVEHRRRFATPIERLGNEVARYANAVVGFEKNVLVGESHGVGRLNEDARRFRLFGIVEEDVLVVVESAADGET